MRDKCSNCGKEENASFYNGVHIQCCNECDELICDECAECDYDMQDDPPRYVCTQWLCKDREQCRKNFDQNFPEVPEGDVAFVSPAGR